MLAIPKSYVAVEFLRQLNIDIYETESEPLTFDLVSSKRLEGSIIDCDATPKKELVIHKPHIYQNQGIW